MTSTQDKPPAVIFWQTGLIEPFHSTWGLIVPGIEHWQNTDIQEDVYAQE